MIASEGLVDRLALSVRHDHLAHKPSLPTAPLTDDVQSGSMSRDLRNMGLAQRAEAILEV